jgi:hypothetical protein
MKPFLRFALSLAVTLPLLAQTAPVTLSASVQPSLAIVDAGAATTFATELRQFGEVQATDVRIVYSVEGDATIERLDGHDLYTCTNSGKTAVCTSAFARGRDSFTVTVRAGSANGGASTLTMTATAAQPVIGGNVSSATLQSYQVVAVETTDDTGAGSLRAAIDAVNGLTNPAKIEFHLPAPVPAEGWFTIIPESPLPPITADRVAVDGKSQTRFTGDTNTRGPEIAIDGRRAHRGLEIHSPCLARVEGLVLGNFDENQGLWFTKSHECTTNFSFMPDARLVADNYIGTDPTGTVAWPNLRGLRGDFGSGTIRNNLISGNTYSGMWIWVAGTQYDSFTIEGNKFGTAADGIAPLPNGAAGMLLGDRVAADVRENIIANHPGMGIALVRGDTFVQIRKNSMRDNGGIGIDWGIDGISPLADDRVTTSPNAPTLLNARYDATENRTYFTVRVTTERPNGPHGVTFVFDFYANRGPDGDGEQWIDEDHGGRYADDSTMEGWVSGDWRGKWVNATVTRVPQFFSRTPRVSTEQLLFLTFGDESTSEFSNAVLVP